MRYTDERVMPRQRQEGLWTYTKCGHTYDRSTYNEHHSNNYRNLSYQLGTLRLEEVSYTPGMISSTTALHFLSHTELVGWEAEE